MFYKYVHRSDPLNIRNGIIVQKISDTVDLSGHQAMNCIIVKGNASFNVGMKQVLIKANLVPFTGVLNR